MLPPNNLDVLLLEDTQEEDLWRDRQRRRDDRLRQHLVGRPSGYDAATGRDLYNDGKIQAEPIAAGGTGLTQLTRGSGTQISIVDAPPYFSA